MAGKTPGVAEIDINISPEDTSSPDTPKGYDDGGVVPDEGTSVMDMDAGNPDTYKLKGLNPVDPLTPPVQPATAPAFNPHAGLAPHMSNPNVPPTPIPPQADPNGIANYIAQQKAQAGAYGPQQQQELQNAILQRQRSPGAIAGNALTGLGDSIIQGVGRAGSSNMQANLQNRLAAQGQQALESQKVANEENKTNVSEQMALTAKDPTSALSKSAQSSYAPLLKSMGATPEQIAKMPADVISEVATKQISMEEALARIKETQLYHGLMAGQQAANLSEKTNEYESSHPINTFLHKVLSGGSSATPAITPDVSAYAAKHGITPEQALQIKMQRGGQ
jgi:hypothetical protein